MRLAFLSLMPAVLPAQYRISTDCLCATKSNLGFTPLLRQDKCIRRWHWITNEGKTQCIMERAFYGSYSNKPECRISR